MKLFKNNILVVSMILLTSCGTKLYQTTPEYSLNKPIDSSIEQDSSFVNTIAPYKEKLKSKMDHILAYAPIDLTKKGYNAPLCNLVADITLDYVNKNYEKANKGKVDIAILNNGGLRRTFAVGNLTIGNIYELSPFDNEIVILDLNGEQVKEMVEFLLKENVGHPIAGITASSTNDIKVAGQELVADKVYKVATNDYLFNGGDNMFFLNKAFKKEELNVKQLDMLLDAFSKMDTVRVNLDKRILK